MSLCKTIDKKIDTTLIREEGAALVESVAEQAERAAEWLSPHVDRARDEVSRYAKDAQDRLTEDYVPRAQRAAVAAQEAVKAPGSVAKRAQRAAAAGKVAVVETTSPRKQHRVLKSVAWFTVAAGAAAAAYVVWRRSQPVEDPWAEEYWADSTDEAEVSDVVEDVKADVAAKVEDVKDAIEKKTK